MAEPPPDQQQPSGSRGIVLPGYRYLGPGNSLDRGVPVNALDAAAKKHDTQYHKITEYFKQTKNRKVFEEQVQAADIEFINEVATYAPETSYDQVAKWLALGGIETKHVIEKYTGILYPRVSEQDKDGNMEVPGNVSSIIGGGVQNCSKTHHFQFKKKFTFAISSTKATYSKSGGNLIYETYIHSIPWQNIFFYMTEKEYDDMTKVFHTAKVTQVGIKITNLGNRTPFLTSTNSVNYANANSQTTIGIWENMEALAPVEMGKGLKPETLYGKTLDKYPDATNEDPDHSTAQAMLMDNKIKYYFKINECSKNFLLPPLIMESTILFNATNSIGPIFEKSYKPVDGTFHTDNDGFESDNLIIRNVPAPNVLNTNTARISNLTYTKYNTKKYEEATVDNLTIGGIFTNAQKNFMGSIGVGIIPLLNKDKSLEDAILNIMVETVIELECMSHGTNLLMGKYDKPQPNTLFAGLAVDKYKWSNKYTVAGAPAVDEGAIRTPVDMEVDPTPEEQIPPPEEQIPPPEPQPTPAPTPDPTPDPTPAPTPAPQRPQTPQPGPSRAPKRKHDETIKHWWDDGEIVNVTGQDVLYIRGEKIPGQKKIHGNMSPEEKIQTAINNEEIRQAAIKVAEDATKMRVYVRGKFLNLGIPEGGTYNKFYEPHVQQIVAIGTKPPVQAKPTTRRKPSTTTQKPQTKPTVKPAVKPVVKPAVKPVVKPQPKPQPKPTPKPTQKPETPAQKQMREIIEETKKPEKTELEKTINPTDREGRPNKNVPQPDVVLFEDIGKEPWHWNWLKITYKGRHFRILLHDVELGSQGNWTADAKLRLSKVPLNKETVSLSGNNETEIWNDINDKLSKLDIDTKDTLFAKIIDCYELSRHDDK